MAKHKINPNLRFLHQELKHSRRSELLSLYESGQITYEQFKSICEDEDIKSGVVLEGSSRCFHAGQLVITANGSIPISKIRPGDHVLSSDGFRSVSDSFKSINKKPSVRIKLKNGNEIICTEDHLFFFEGSWVSIKHILSLWNARDMEADTKI